MIFRRSLAESMVVSPGILLDGKDVGVRAVARGAPSSSVVLSIELGMLPGKRRVELGEVTASKAATDDGSVGEDLLDVLTRQGPVVEVDTELEEDGLVEVDLGVRGL